MPVKLRWININVVGPKAVNPHDILIDGDRITAVIPRGTPAGEDRRVIDGGGGFLIPGIVDLFQNGIGAQCYADVPPGAVARASDFLLQAGCTAFVPSFGCQPPDRLDAALAGLAAELPNARGARALGIHAEGPCFALTGAHNPANLDKPSSALVDRMLRASDGRLLINTLAPELPGAEGFVRALKAAGVSVHMGHTNADPHMVARYVAWGIDAVTHMFDVMPQKAPDGSGVHVPNLTDSLMAEAGLPLGLICDGIHAHPRLVRLLAQLGPDRVFLETDAFVNDTEADIRFETFPGHWVTSRPGQAVRDDHGGLNGGSLRPDEQLRNYITFGNVDLVQAMHAASLVPARVIGRAADMGSIEPGKLADLALLAPDTLEVRATMVGGTLLYERARGGAAGPEAQRTPA